MKKEAVPLDQFFHNTHTLPQRGGPDHLISKWLRRGVFSVRPGQIFFLSEVRVGDSFKSDTGQLLEKGHSLHVRDPSQLGFPGAKRWWH